MMNKYIRPIFLLNEAVAFAAVKPFYNSIRHNDILLSKISHSSKLEVANLTNGSFLQNETGLPIKGRPLLIVTRITPFFKKSSGFYKYRPYRKVTLILTK
jgi:hypothetical protein